MGETDLVHQGPEEGQIPVDITDSDDAPSRREGGVGDDSPVHSDASL